MQVIAVICVLVWVINIGRFGDALHGGWVRPFSQLKIDAPFQKLQAGLLEQNIFIHDYDASWIVIILPDK